MSEHVGEEGAENGAPSETFEDPGIEDPVAEDSVTDNSAESQESSDHGSQDSSAGSAPAEQADPSLEELLQERTNDLQRLQAEYVNYKRRVDRDRELAREAGMDAVLKDLLSVLDDLDRAESHGELDGGFKAVAESIRQIARTHRMEKFGAIGEAFDPNLHQAVTHNGQSEQASVTAIDLVFAPGYKVGERILRPATVAVVDPID